MNTSLVQLPESVPPIAKTTEMTASPTTHVVCSSPRKPMQVSSSMSTTPQEGLSALTGPTKSSGVTTRSGTSRPSHPAPTSSRSATTRPDESNRSRGKRNRSRPHGQRTIFQKLRHRVAIPFGSRPTNRGASPTSIGTPRQLSNWHGRTTAQLLTYANAMVKQRSATNSKVVISPLIRRARPR